MHEDWLPYQVGGAVFVGWMLGMVVKRRRWPPFWSVGAGVISYIALLIVIASVNAAATEPAAVPEPPVTFGMVLGACLFVAPGFFMFFALPFILAFVFAYMVASRKPVAGAG